MSRGRSGHSKKLDFKQWSDLLALSIDLTANGTSLVSGGLSFLAPAIILQVLAQGRFRCHGGEQVELYSEGLNPKRRRAADDPTEEHPNQSMVRVLKHRAPGSHLRCQTALAGSPRQLVRLESQ